MEENVTIHKEIIEPFIRITKSSVNGNYGWDIKMSGKDTNEIIKDIMQINNKLNKEFVKKEEGIVK